MKVDLSKLFDNPGALQMIDTQLDLSAVVKWGNQLISTPARVAGKVENRSGVVYAAITVDFLLETVCDRCLTVISRQERMEFSHILVLSLNREDNSEFIVVSDGKLNLAELVLSDILLEIPTSMVCDKDCKGLCPTCGMNLNEGVCSCDHKASDSRFDKLRELLKD